MGEVIGAALVAHVPTIMLPEATRLQLNDGKEISLVPGLRRMKTECLDRIDGTLLRLRVARVLDRHPRSLRRIGAAGAVTRGGRRFESCRACLQPINELAHRPSGRANNL